MTKLDRVTSQWTSGRFLLTQIAGLCIFMFALADTYVAIVAARKGINIEKLPFDVGQLFIIITTVFMSYFAKKTGESDSTKDVHQP